MNIELFAAEKDPEETETMLVSLVGSYVLDTLMDSEHRRQHKEQCLQRLRVQENSKLPVDYAEQAILANLDWGMDALDEAISSSTEDSKKARLQHAEKMLQVCANLDSKGTTAGVPNSYLSAWAHLNLAFVWKLRNDDRNSAKHMMDMFLVDPCYGRMDFAPVLWEHLFQPQLSSITTWYSNQRRKILMRGGSSDGQVSSSSKKGFYSTADTSILSSVSPEQASQLQHLENLYQDSLDDHTKRLAFHFKSCLNFDSPNKWEPSKPPITPLGNFGNSDRELSDEEPDLSPIHENADFIQKGSTSTSGGQSAAQDFFVNLSCNPMWEDDDEDETMEGSEKIGNAGLENTKFYDSDAPEVGLMQRNHVKNGSNNSWSPEEVMEMYTHPELLVGSQSIGKRPKSQGEQQEASHLDTCLSSIGMHRQPSQRHQHPYESSLSMSSDAESELEMEEPKSARLKQTESMDLDRRHRSLSNCSSLSYGRKDVINSTISDGHDQGLKNNSHDGEFGKTNWVNRPPKDFVCSITGHLFNDPVTIETGQTYERRAIQDWLDHGNTTCPITRQALSSRSLPKSNYVLKRLIASWKEQNSEVAQEFTSFSRPETPPSATFHPKQRQDQTSIGSPHGSPWSTSSTSSRVAQITRRQSFGSSPETPLGTPRLGRILNELKQILSTLCTSEDLQECEQSLLMIKQFFFEAKGHQHVQNCLTERSVIDSLLEVLFNSSSGNVWDAGIIVLSGLVKNNDLAKDLILRADANLECILSLLRRGVMGTVVLLHQLKLPILQISNLNLIPDLIKVLREGITRKEPTSSITPRTAALDILCQIVSGEDLQKQGPVIEDILSMDSMLALILCLKEKNSEEKLKALSLLLYCIQTDGECRDFIARETNVALVLDLLHYGNSTTRLVTISFLSELTHLSRRTANNVILKVIKEEGMLSSMHILLAYLQLTPQEQRPLVAGLLLQIDLLEVPRRRSMYRDEAMEALIDSLTDKDSIIPQILAAETLVSLVGHFSTSGKPLAEAWLFKIANLEDATNVYADGTQFGEWVEDKEEQCASKEWERRIAKGLLGYEQGAILSALSQPLLSKSSELSRPSMVAAVWILRMIPLLPDTGVRTTACHFLLHPFLSILKSSKDIEKQVLAVLALQSFLDHSESLQKLITYAKEICGPLRELQKTTWVAREIFSSIVKDPSVNVTELWVHEDVGEIDLSLNGSIRAFARARGHIFSGHSDGTIKVWDGKSRLPCFVHELKKHTKEVTSLAVSQSTDRLYSGSLDKSIMIWSLGSGRIQCIQVLEQRDEVVGMVVNGPMICVVPQTAGVQVQYENSETKILNLGKHVQSVVYSDGKIYCGCIDSSIQELDPKDGSNLTIQPSAKTIIGKRPIYTLQVFKNKIYAAGTPADGMAVKVWDQADKSLLGTIASTNSAEIRAMVINEDFIYLGTNTGAVEVWSRERLTRIAVFNVGSKVTCLLLNGSMLFCGSEDGKLRMFASS